MSTRYYLQRAADMKPSLRRYSGAVGTPGHRWEGKEWSRECASEFACLRTGDESISETDAARFILQISNGARVV